MEINFAHFNHELLSHCLHHGIVPLTYNKQRLEVAATSEKSASVSTTLRLLCSQQIKVTIWSQQKIDQALQKLHYEYHNLTEQKINSPHYQEQSLIDFINKLLQQALTLRASDIHIEPSSPHCRIRMRVDGVLKTFYHSLPYPTVQVIARIKIMATLNIAEKRIPQDGQLIFGIQHVSFRVSTLPLLEGEKVVLRAIGSDTQPLCLTHLGLPEPALQLLKHALNQPQGLILVTGATGSGKTATLYSALRYLNQESINICSIEDPIEQPIHGINQTQINPKAKLTFASTLRALLRQDPDVIMIGEIRDKETAIIAIEAAQTGHLVLSTLHTNSTTETLTRLQQMGIEHYQLISALTLIVSQRLIRKLCKHCCVTAKTQYVSPYDSKQTYTHWQEKGCQHCLGGYLQRTGIFEALPITDEIKQALLESSKVKTLQTVAKQQGMQTLLQHGLTLLQQGVTSLSELHRVLGYEADEKA